ncbi:MAG: hypothetical protein H0W01_17695 [Pseudonocardiales bacterium]|nr:hypothetical protein [Pseudonocardiales bacterium]
MKDQRAGHLVGSIPGDDTAAVMRGAAQRLGGRLRMLPDGETGERRNWIVHVIESLRNHPDLEIVRQATGRTTSRPPG